MVDADLALKLIYIFGITNIIFLALVLFSCRCMGFWKLTRRFFSNETYQKFYRYHCYYWYGLFISVIMHTTIAFYLFGNPFFK